MAVMNPDEQIGHRFHISGPVGKRTVTLDGVELDRVRAVNVQEEPNSLQVVTVEFLTNGAHVEPWSARTPAGVSTDA